MIILILILGFILRLVSSNQSLWLDEAINVLAAKDLSFWQFVSSYPVGDFHPPLYFGILWIWSHLFGYSEIFLRLPSIFLGLGTIYVSYLLGKDLFSKKVGLLAALILALNPLHIYYSQEARMYSLSAFSAVLSFYFLNKLLEDKRWVWWYSFSIILCLYSDYLTYLVLPAQLIFIVLCKRKYLREVLMGQIVGMIFLVPWLFVFPKQLQSGVQTAQAVPGWKAVVGGSSFKNLALIFVKSIIGRISFANKYMYGAVVGLVGFFYGALGFQVLKKIDERIKLLICWISIPVILAFSISFYTPVLSYFRMIYLVPAFCLVLGYGLTLINKKFFKVSLLVLILVNSVFIFMYYLNPNFQREDWKGLAQFTNSQNPNTDLVLFENDNVIAPYRFYTTHRVEAEGALKNFPANSEADLKDLNILTKNRVNIFLVDYLVGISDPSRLVDKSLTADGFKVVKVYNFPAVGFVYDYQR